MYSQKTKTGKYRFFESFIDPVTQLRKTASVTLDKDTTKSRKHAQALLYARIDALTGQTVNPSNMTLASLLEAYRDAQKGILRPQTLTHNYSIMGKVAGMFPDVPIANLNARLVTSTFAKLDAPPAKKNSRLRMLKTLLRWGYRMDYISDISWLDKLTMYPDDVKTRRAKKYLEPDELKKVVDAADPDYQSIILFLALSGLRIGEVIALTPADIDDVIHVTKTYSTTTGEVGTPKTNESIRDVYIQKELKEVIENANSTKTALLTVGGKRIDYFKFNLYFAELTENTIGRRLSPHALRHTHVSLLAAAGVPLSLITRRLGHANSKITQEIYFHVTESLKDKEAALLDAITLL